jgi:hypothetical protein
MNLYKEALKLFSNKYFLYFMGFLAATNVLGYLVTKRFNAVMIFALICLVTFSFNKNIAIVLLVALIATNFLMAPYLREGMENNTDDATEKAKERDPVIQSAVDALEETDDVDSAQDMMQQSNQMLQGPDELVDPNNQDLNRNKEEEEGPEGVGEKITNHKKTKTESFVPRLDYAATLDQSYQNLDQILSSDAIQKLTTDTQKLMKQQQNLFNTMNQMVPVLEGAQNMLKGFDIKSLTSSLSQVASVVDTK